MKKYIGDGLSATRFVLAFCIAPAVIYHIWWLATVMFLVAMLTDAVDGMAARRWPYPPDEHHWWRRDSHLVDNIPDGALFFAVLVWLSVDNPFWWLVMAGSVIATGLILFSISYVGKFNAVAAERIDVVYGWLYASLLVAMLVTMTVNATSHWSILVFLLLSYAAIGLVVLITKWDRATTRPETRARFMQP